MKLWMLTLWMNKQNVKNKYLYNKQKLVIIFLDVDYGK